MNRRNKDVKMSNWIVKNVLKQESTPRVGGGLGLVSTSLIISIVLSTGLLAFVVNGLCNLGGKNYEECTSKLILTIAIDALPLYILFLICFFGLSLLLGMLLRLFLKRRRQK